MSMEEELLKIEALVAKCPSGLQRRIIDLSTHYALLYDLSYADSLKRVFDEVVRIYWDKKMLYPCPITQRDWRLNFYERMPEAEWTDMKLDWIKIEPAQTSK